MANTLVVIEGVLMYLDKVRVKKLLEQATGCFSCPCIDVRVAEQDVRQQVYAKNTREQTVALGSPFTLLEERPEQLFLGSGYKRCGEPISVVGRTRDFKAIIIPGFLFGTVLRSMRDGYRVHTFEFS